MSSIERFGSHDVGGVDSLQNSPVDLSDTSKADSFWETRCHAFLKLLESKGLINLHQLRKGVEALDGERYARLGYYDKWTLSIHAQLVSQGTLTQSELDVFLGVPPMSSEQPLYKPGDRVRVRREDVLATRWRRPHLRVPGYIFGCVGTVVEVLGVFEDPESATLVVPAQQGLEIPKQPNYRVQFLHADVWEIAAAANVQDMIEVEIAQNWLTLPEDVDHQYTHPSNLTFQPTQGCENPSSSSSSSHEHHHHEHHHEHHHDKDDHEHHHHHDHDDESTPHVHEKREIVEQNALQKEGIPSPYATLCHALISCLVSKQLITHAELSACVEKIEMACHAAVLGGARLVARAWVDPEFKARLLRDANAVCDELGVMPANPHNPIIKCFANDASTHHLVVCTLCSCYPLALLGRSPSWYKSRAYRARAVRDPRRLLLEFGTDVGAQRAIRVHDSCSELRYLVIPERPSHTADWSEEQLQALISRDAMIGVRLI